MAAGWRREPEPADPAATPWTRAPTAPSSARLSVLVSGSVPDEHPVPSVNPKHPRLERVLSWVAPWWSTRRAAARVARYQHAVWRRITDAHDERHRAPDLPSRYGAAWRGSHFWHR